VAAGRQARQVGHNGNIRRRQRIQDGLRAGDQHGDLGRHDHRLKIGVGVKTLYLHGQMLEAPAGRERVDHNADGDVLLGRQEDARRKLQRHRAAEAGRLPGQVDGRGLDRAGDLLQGG